MTTHKYRKAMRTLDHAIDSLGPTKPCFLLVTDGRMHNVQSTHDNADAARAVLVSAMLELVKERP